MRCHKGNLGHAITGHNTRTSHQGILMTTTVLPSGSSCTRQGRHPYVRNWCNLLFFWKKLGSQLWTPHSDFHHYIIFQLSLNNICSSKTFLNRKALSIVESSNFKPFPDLVSVFLNSSLWNISIVVCGQRASPSGVFEFPASLTFGCLASLISPLLTQDVQL